MRFSSEDGKITIEFEKRDTTDEVKWVEQQVAAMLTMLNLLCKARNRD